MTEYIVSHCAFLFLSEVCQISTNFNKFSHGKVTEIVCCIYFPPNLTHVTALPCETLMF